MKKGSQRMGWSGLERIQSLRRLKAVSRVAPAITTPEQRAIARRARQLLDARRDVKELVEIGAYVHGTNPNADRALTVWPQLEAFLTQDLREVSNAAVAWDGLAAVLGEDRNG